MKLRLIAAIAGGLVLLAMLGGAGWIMSLPPAPQAVAAPLIPDEEVQTMLAALKPPKRERPVVAIIGINDATETTDYLMPAGILRRADVADVMLLATGPEAVKLYPALTVIGNASMFWAKEDMGLQLEPGMDEVSLALLADAWSRTYRSRALTFAGDEQVSRSGVRIVPDRADRPADRRLTGMKHGAPARVLDLTLQDIAMHYGQPTADVVAMQLEYPKQR